MADNSALGTSGGGAAPPTFTLLQKKHAPSVSVHLCSTMDLAALVGTDGSVSVYRTLTWERVLQRPASEVASSGSLPTAVSFCPSGKVLALGHASGELTCLDVESGDIVQVQSQGQSQSQSQGQDKNQGQCQGQRRASGEGLAIVAVSWVCRSETGFNPTPTPAATPALNPNFTTTHPQPAYSAPHLATPLSQTPTATLTLPPATPALTLTPEEAGMEEYYDAELGESRDKATLEPFFLAAAGSVLLSLSLDGSVHGHLLGLYPLFSWLPQASLGSWPGAAGGEGVMRGLGAGGGRVAFFAGVGEFFPWGVLVAACPDSGGVSPEKVCGIASSSSSSSISSSILQYIPLPCLAAHGALERCSVLVLTMSADLGRLYDLLHGCGRKWKDATKVCP